MAELDVISRNKRGVKWEVKLQRYCSCFLTLDEWMSCALGEKSHFLNTSKLCALGKLQAADLRESSLPGAGLLLRNAAGKE